MNRRTGMGTTHPEGGPAQAGCKNQIRPLRSRAGRGHPFQSGSFRLPPSGMPFPTVNSVAFIRRLLLGACLLAAGGSLRADSPALLTEIREIRALSAERAEEDLPVHVRGVITRLTPHELFIQEGPDAIFVERRRHDPALRMGDYIDIRGVTDDGHFFPIIKEAGIY